MERQNPDFLQYYFFKRHLLAFATDLPGPVTSDPLE